MTQPDDLTEEPSAGDRIAIVGIGGVFPGANGDLDQFWSMIESGTDAGRHVPEGRWVLDPALTLDPTVGAPDKVYSTWGCYLDAVQADLTGLGLDAELLVHLDPVCHLALQASRSAIGDLRGIAFDRTRTGVILGHIILPTEYASAHARGVLGRALLERIGLPIDEAALPTIHPWNSAPAALPATLIASAFGLNGPAFTLDAACASSLYAIKLGCDELCSGRADTMLVGGVSRPDCLYTQMGFAQLHALSRSGRCRPLCADADGLVVGEGAGVLILRRHRDALRDGNRIHATIAGVGLSNDMGGSLLAPRSEGQLRAMRSAYRQANWQPSDVDLIECHATGTPVGDAVEIESLHELRRQEAIHQSCVIGCVKSNVGHLLTAAGAAGVIKVLLAMRHQTLPPTANLTTPARSLQRPDSPFRVLSSAIPWQERASAVSGERSQPRRAAVSGFGFGGINAHLLLEEWTSRSRLPSGTSPAGPAQATGLQTPPENRPIISTEPREMRDPRRVLPASSPDQVRFGKRGLPSDKPYIPIAIVGLAAHFGGWRSLDEFQERVLGGAAGGRRPAEPKWWGIERTRWFRTNVPERTIAGFYIDQLELPVGRFRIPPKEMEETLPQQLLMLKVAGDALSDARLTGDLGERAGVFVGIGLDLNTTNFHCRWSLPELAVQRVQGELENESQAWITQLRESIHPALTANRTMGALGGIVASRLAREFGVGGPSFTCSSDETSGLTALSIAVRALQYHEIDVALTGAVDLAGDVRLALANAVAPADGIQGEGAGAVVLKRLDDARAAGDYVYAIIKEIDTAEPLADRVSSMPMNAKGDVGYTGAASGIASFVKACLCLEQQTLPGSTDGAARPQFWLWDRVEGPRSATVQEQGRLGPPTRIVLESFEPAQDRCAIEPCRRSVSLPAGLFAVAGDTPTELLAALDRLSLLAAESEGTAADKLARTWHRQHNERTHSSAYDGPLRLAIVASSAEQLRERIQAVRGLIESGGDRAVDGVYFRPRPIGASPIAFVYPGSGNHFPDMGRSLFTAWPEVLRRQDAENQSLRSQFASDRFWHAEVASGASIEPKQAIFAQVSFGCAVTDLLAKFGIRPNAAIGYSLGESAALFALRAWTDRDEMLARMQASPLFGSELVAPFEAARTAWNLPADRPVDWVSGIIDRGEDVVRPALDGLERAYLLIVNTPGQCVVGGDSSAVEALRRRTGGTFLPLASPSTVHCPVAGVIAERYRQLHDLPVTPPAGVRFYSTAWASPYELTRERATEAIVAQALDTIDFPAVVERAYSDGVRVFIEPGPGSSCTRMISDILAGRQHVAVAACPPRSDGVGSFLAMLGQLFAERVWSNLDAVYPEPETTEHVAASNNGAKTITIPVGRGPFDPPPLSGPPRENGKGMSRLPSGISPADQTKYAEFESYPMLSAHVTPARAEVPLGKRDLPLANSALLPNQDNITERIATIPAVQLSDLTMQLSATLTATADAHEAFLRFAQHITDTAARQLEHQFAGSVAVPAAARMVAPARGAGLQTLPQSRPEVATEPRVMSPSAQSTAGSGTPRRAQGSRDARRAWAPAIPRGYPPRALDRDECMEFAVGSIGKVLGPNFAPIDEYPTRVRLPDEPLMLVDRILSIEGEPCSMTSGRVVTEHDVLPGAWYLDGNRIPTCIAVEAGQADLFLSGFLGIDFETGGQAVYRLLDAVVTFHAPLPQPGAVIHYDIRINRFFKQGDTFLFRFEFDGTVDGVPLLTMRDGCAGFFTRSELDAGKGVVQTNLDKQPSPKSLPADWTEWTPMAVESYSDEQIAALRDGNLAACFGESFEELPLRRPTTIPGGMMRLIDRVVLLDPTGGRFGLGIIRAEADIHPDDWFLTCHFVDDRVMPGTLMYECCLHTLRVFLLRLGWVFEEGEAAYEPVPGVSSRLKCRGQVTESVRTVTYEVAIKELGYRPEPYVLADALMYADGKPIVEMTNMSLRLSGLTKARLTAIWNAGGRGSCRAAAEETAPGAGPLVRSTAGSGDPGRALPGSEIPLVKRDLRKPAIFAYDRILAFAVGNPSEAFGDPYRIFDTERVIARLPGPPYQFLDRVTAIDAEPWKMVAGGVIEAQYDVPPDAWYFASDRQPFMPFSVLLEVALQPCGWLAAYVGSALTSPIDLSFRNLGGQGTLHQQVRPDCGVLTTTVKLTNVSASGGMIIQNYDFRVTDARGLVYAGDTYFGFFSKAALANQVGLREVPRYSFPEPSDVQSFTFPTHAPYPDDMMRMVAQVDAFLPDGGAHGLGLIRGSVDVDPAAWFFKAHFHQDPVWPGSLGLESFLQLLKVVALARFGEQAERATTGSQAPRGNSLHSTLCVPTQSSGTSTVMFSTLDHGHRWTYRGQVIPSDKIVTVEAEVIAVDPVTRSVRANGLLSVDGRIIYQMTDFSLTLSTDGP